MKKKINNTAQNSITEKVRSKKVNETWEEYINIKTLQYHPANGAFKDRIFMGAPIYVEEKKDCYNITEYIFHMGLPAKTYYEWLKQKPEYQIAHDTALSIISFRLEKITIDRNLGTNQGAAYILPRYSKVWRDEQEHRANLSRKEIDSTNETKIVVIEKYPESSLVPQKKIDDDQTS